MSVIRLFFWLVALVFFFPLSLSWSLLSIWWFLFEWLLNQRRDIWLALSLLLLGWQMDLQFGFELGAGALLLLFLVTVLWMAQERLTSMQYAWIQLSVGLTCITAFFAFLFPFSSLLYAGNVVALFAAFLWKARFRHEKKQYRELV